MNQALSNLRSWKTRHLKDSDKGNKNLIFHYIIIKKREMCIMHLISKKRT